MSDHENTGRRLLWTRLIGLGVPAVILLTTIGSGGIWDPYELNVADFGRRIAINVWGAKSLILADGENGMPTLGDLGRGELPFTSIGAGFAAFGLHEWAGRLPLALWAMAGIVALYWMFKRLSDERAAACATIVLATMPMYFVQARTMLGDIVSMAALAIAVSGLGIAVFDKEGRRVLPVLVGVLGLGAGLMCRGAMFGVAIPALTVGLGWLVSSAARRSDKPDPLGTYVALGCLVAGAIAAIGGIRGFTHLERGIYSIWVSVPAQPQSQWTTFDYVIHLLGHGLFPWSAFIPLAVGRMFRAPEALSGAAEEREISLRTLLVLGSALAFGAQALVSTKTGPMGFVGVALLAGIAAVALRDLERGAPASRALGMGVVLFIGLFYRDFSMFPEKGFSAFAVNATSFPDTFAKTAGMIILLTGGIFAVLVFASWFERDEPDHRVFNLEEFLQLPKAIRTVWNGNLAFALVVVEAALAGFAVLVFIGAKAHWKSVIGLGAGLRWIALNGWWAVPVICALAILCAYSFRDLCRVFFRTTKISRAWATLAGGALAGAVLSFWYYPALAAQLSPKEVFESYGRLRKGDERLALLGVNARSATYYSGSETRTFSDSDSAFKWLMDGEERRWLVIRNEDLAKLNTAYRGKVRPAANLPLLDARSSQILLASNKLLPGEKNLNPLDEIVLNERPQPTHPLDTDLEGKLVALGWDIVDLKSGTPVPSVVAGKKYRIRAYYQVTARLSGDWEYFIHIDGHQRRFNGDHKPTDGKYPTSMWQPGDYVVDDYSFALEPNFTPASYNLYYGLFMGDTRLKVTRGPHSDNRIDGGFVVVQ